MEKHTKSQEEIAQDVKNYFRQQGLTLQEVGERMGCSSQSVSNQLSGRPIGKNVAKRYNELFGFDIPFLLTGKGELLPGYGKKDAPEKEQDGVFIPRETLELYNNLSASVLRLTELLAEKEKPAKSAPLYHNYATYQK